MVDGATADETQVEAGGIGADGIEADPIKGGGIEGDQFDDDAALHRRSLDIHVFDRGDTLTVRSRLRDERPWHPDPERLVLHDMSLELQVGLVDMTITEARATMHTFPHEECPLIAPRFAKLVGVSVARGFTRALRDAFAGVSGCSHLHELARATGPAVVQARIGQNVRRRHNARIAQEAGIAPTTPIPGSAATDPAIGSVMRGTCHMFAEDGPAIRKLAAGWLPNPLEYPAPSLEKILARVAAQGHAGKDAPDA